MLFLLKVRHIGRMALGVLGVLFILEGIRDGWRSYGERAEADNPEAIRDVPTNITEVPYAKSVLDLAVDERRRLFTSYILSRVEKVAFTTDPVALHVQALAEYLAVPLEIRTAKQELNKGFPPTLARAVEELLTGDVWTEAMEGPAARPLG